MPPTSLKNQKYLEKRRHKRDRDWIFYEVLKPLWSEQLLKSLHSEIIHWRCYAILLILLGSAELFFPGVKWFDGSFSFLFAMEKFCSSYFFQKNPPNSFKVSTMYLHQLHNTNYNQVLVACMSSILLDNIFVINRLQKKTWGWHDSWQMTFTFIRTYLDLLGFSCLRSTLPYTPFSH